MFGFVSADDYLNHPPFYALFRGSPLPDQLRESRSEITGELMLSDLTLNEKEELCATIDIILKYYEEDSLQDTIVTMTELQSIISITAYNFDRMEASKARNDFVFREYKDSEFWEHGSIDFQHPEITKRLESLSKTVKSSETHMKLKQVEFCFEKLRNSSICFGDVHSNLAERVTKVSTIFNDYVNTFIKDCRYLLSSLDAVRDSHFRGRIEAKLMLMYAYQFHAASLLYMYYKILEELNSIDFLFLAPFAVQSLLVLLLPFSLQCYGYMVAWKHESLILYFHKSCFDLNSNNHLLDELRTVCRRINPFPNHPALSKAGNQWNETEQYCKENLERVLNSKTQANLDKLVKEGSQLAGDFSKFIEHWMENYKKKANKSPIINMCALEFVDNQVNNFLGKNPFPMFISKLANFCERIQETRLISEKEKSQCEATEAILSKLEAYFEGTNTDLENYNASTLAYETSVRDAAKIQTGKLKSCEAILMFSSFSTLIPIITLTIYASNRGNFSMPKIVFRAATCVISVNAIIMGVLHYRVISPSSRDSKSQFESFSLLAA